MENDSECLQYAHKSPLGPSIKYVTLFLANFDTPSPVTLCHTSRTPHKVRHISKLEVCGYSIFATRPIPVAQDRYPYPSPTRTQNYYPTRPVPAGIPVPVRPSLSSVPMHIVYVR